LDIIKQMADFVPVVVIVPVWFIVEALKVFARRIERIGRNTVIDWLICYVSPLVIGAFLMCMFEY